MKTGWGMILVVGVMSYMAGNVIAAPGDAERAALVALEQAAADQLFENILPFWLTHGIDHEQGGFIGRARRDGARVPDAPKGLVLNARLLWTFSAVYRTRRDDVYLRTARRAYEALDRGFRDPVHGGYYWMLDAAGKPIDDRKELYGNAFVVYALAEYHQATGDEAARQRLVDLFDCIEHHARDSRQGGYFETFGRDWTPAATSSLAHGVDGGVKTMNTHLHLLEAYTNLVHAVRDERTTAALRHLLDVFDEHIYDARDHYCKLFFDRSWKSLKEMTSYGHDIEAAWLLRDAARALRDARWLERTRQIAMEIGMAVERRGLDADGGLLYEGTPDSVTNHEKHWWPQAETVVGYLDLYESTGDPRWLDIAVRNWRYTEKHIVDPVHGEWFGRAAAEHGPDDLKISEWKAPYHNGRACLEVLRRVDRLEHLYARPDPR